MKLGDAFRLYSYKDKLNHLWFVAYEADDTIVIFNFSSWRLHKDLSCKISPTEYSELTGVSVVMYDRGEVLVGSNSIQNLENYGIRATLEPVPQPVLNKVVRGAVVSEFIHPNVQKFFLPK